MIYSLNSTSNELVSPSQSFIRCLKSLLGDSGWRENTENASGYLTERRGLFQGRAALIARPDSTDQTAAVVRLCAEARTPIVPYGGGTGLVGGQIRPDGPPGVVLSLERMRAVRAVNPAENAMTLEAGAPLAAAQQAAAEAGRLFPLSLASEGSCTVGGVLATNAGGVQVLKYGSARDLCLGLEVVTPSGDIWNGLSSLRKDNTGYDLKGLYVGSEGTLGVITAATLKLFPQPQARVCAFVALPGIAQAIDLLRQTQEVSGDAVAVFEVMAATGLGFALKHAPGARSPVSAPAPWFALIELWGAEEGALTHALETVLSDRLESGAIVDAAIAQNTAQAQSFRHLRESLSDVQRLEGASIKHDISLPISAIPAFLPQAAAAVERIAPGSRPCPFGHLGDGNLHYNISQPVGGDSDAFLAKWSKMNEAVHDLVAEFGGSFSAEHGIGRLKAAELRRRADPAKWAALCAIKAALDPKGVMNPGAVFAPDFA